jgi:MFS family permease
MRLSDDRFPEGTNKEVDGWLNRNVLAFGLTSLLGDICHEMATAVLPQFMRAIGAGAAALGAIEGVADALSSFVKLGAGFHSDKIGHRKGWTVAGYALTSVAKAIFAFALAWPLILVGRVLGWFGRGIRGPLRDAMLADSVAPRYRGKAFGFHRAGDTVGAVVGPLLAFWLLGLAADHPAMLDPFKSIFPLFASAPGPEFRVIFLLTLVPGLLSVASILFLGKEKRRPANHKLNFWNTLRSMPKDYRAFLLAVGIFGLADFAPTLMILRATNLLEGPMGIMEASRTAALLYLFRNIIYTVASYPIGALSDRFLRSRFLAVGYSVAVVTFLGFALAPPSLGWLMLFFGLAGVFIAWEDTIEGAAVRDYIDESTAGTAFGLLGVVNGIGDLVSSLVVGLLWTAIGASWGFGYAVVVSATGAVYIAQIRPKGNRSQEKRHRKEIP